jgi:hypothetical protein
MLHLQERNGQTVGLCTCSIYKSTMVRQLDCAHAPFTRVKWSDSWTVHTLHLQEFNGQTAGQLTCTNSAMYGQLVNEDKDTALATAWKV